MARTCDKCGAEHGVDKVHGNSSKEYKNHGPQSSRETANVSKKYASDNLCQICD